MHARNAIFSLATFLLAAGCTSAESGDPGDFAEAESALSTVYRVGPTRAHKTLGAVAGLLAPGDVVEVDGNATYTGGIRLARAGTPAQKITIRGVPVSGKRPLLSGGINTIELAGNHTVLEGFEVRGGTSRCIFHHAHDITVRDTVVHDCPAHGILGADTDSGSLLLDHVEVYASGSGTTKHPIYIATDESAYPGSVFRMQHSYVHHNNGGNSVKSRAERNEIYYNWIEGGLYKELELIGPDGQAEDLAREDSDVVGNVFKKTKTQFVVRVGGDGTGDTNGRYRFVNNTFLLMQGSSAAIHAFDRIESLEMHNNVFHRIGGGSVQVLRDDGVWASGSPLMAGRNNSVPVGTALPAGWQATLVKNDPGFVDLAAGNVALSAASSLVNAGTTALAGPANAPFPSPLAAPLFAPPVHQLAASMAVVARPQSGAIDIGAHELAGAVSSPAPAPAPAPGVTCKTGSPTTWSPNAIPARTGAFTASWDVTPSASGVDGAVALSLGEQTTWGGLAAIVRFNTTNTIDVRDGDLYAADAQVGYTAGVAVRVRMVVDVPSKTYSVYVRPSGGAEVLIAANYSFRTQQQGVASLDHWVVNQIAAGKTLDACGFTIQ